ncbi:uncharacterized protein B0T15DRAFT_216984 [Chaetomium strumarium]|uniref:WSC domain-containing protein n=1 Tax=Chaetomium strumarium TaxID=1170767 RepID=A0AAJ0GTZ9_9PEZI|nr:hypothetical protein B0T15DRAFT_216984 [Chaetomium strumarium]
MKSVTFLAAALAALADAMPDPFVPAIELHDGKVGRVGRVGRVARAVPKGEQQPITPPVLDSPTVQGCFKSSGDLVFNTTIKYNTIGICATDTCYHGGFAVGGSTGGNQCWCGNSYPPKDDLVEDSKCNVPCPGFGDHACGGIDTWTIYNTGVTLAVKYKDDPSTTKSSTSSTSSPTQSATKVGETVVVTATPTSDAEKKPSGGTNTGGIVAGVVVAVVVVAAAVAGGFFYLRRKRNQEIEEEHRRNAAVSAFIGKPPGSSSGTSMTDSRLDPVMAQRRMSDGSIADNQDYSRRILRVTNA